MKKIFKAKFIQEMCDVTANMYRQGWDERNGGNVSYMLDECEVKKYLNVKKVIREIDTGICAPELVGKYFIITGTGKYFKNVAKDPETNLGIIKIKEDGKTAELLWGYKDGGRFTSETPAHLMSHMARLKVNPKNRIIIHTHPTYTIAMNTCLEVDEKLFTRKLWQSNTECVVVFPDGVGMLPCMVCGTTEIGEATAKKMKDFRLVVWTNHGIYGAGETMDEAFGLIETVEKTAQIYMLSLGHVVNVIPNEVIEGIAKLWGCKMLDGVLE